MATSQNGYPALSASTPGDGLDKWVIPVGRNGEYRHIILREGHAGYVLACFATWFHRRIEYLNEGQWDEWGWAYRPVRGTSSGLSNHASGTAMDLNATQHPLGVRNTFYGSQMRKIRRRLKFYRHVIRWGGDYTGRADEMHFEINKPLRDVIKLARFVRWTPIGRAVLRHNPHYSPKWRERALRSR